MEHDPRNDHELFQAFKNGDGDAFNELYTRHHNIIRAFLKRFTKAQDADVEDIEQETWARIARSEFKGDSPFLTWAHKVAITQARNRARAENATKRRGKHKHVSESDVTYLSGNEATPLSYLIRRDEAHQIRKKVNALPKRQRDTLVAFYLHGEKIPEIAKATNTGIGTVKSRLSRGLVALRQEAGVA